MSTFRNTTQPSNIPDKFKSVIFCVSSPFISNIKPFVGFLTMSVPVSYDLAFVNQTSSRAVHS